MTTATRNAIPLAYQEPRIPHVEVGYRVWHALNAEAQGSNALARVLSGNPKQFDSLYADWLQPDRRTSNDSLDREYEQRAAQDERDRTIGARYAAAALVKVGQRLRDHEDTELQMQQSYREHGHPDLAEAACADRLHGIRTGLKALDAAWEDLFTGRLDPLRADEADASEGGDD